MRTTRRDLLRQAGRAGLGLAAAHLAGGRGLAQPAPEPIGIVVGSDVHLRTDQALSPASFREFVADVNDNLPRAQRVLLLGDLVDVGYPAALEAFAELQTELRPTVHGVPGNHDFAPAAEGEARAEADARSLERFCAVLGHAPSPYYAFAVGNVRFVMVGTEASSSNPPEISFGGWLGDAQLTWLDGQLADADAQRQNVIVCSHQGVRDTCWLTATPPYSLNPPGPLQEILAHRSVDIWFSGHVHGVLQEHHAQMFATVGGTLYVNGGALSHSRNGRLQSRYFVLNEGAAEVEVRSRDHVDVRQGPEAEHDVRCFDPALDTVAPLRHPFRRA